MTENKMVDLDLDAILPEKRTIKLNGKTFLINPPDVGELFSMAKLGLVLKNAQDGSINESEAAEGLAQLQEALKKVIPEIKDEKLTIGQLMALFKFIGEIVKPAQLTALEDNGISVDLSEKKTT